MKEYCYLVKFYDEDNRLIVAEPYTTPAKNSGEAFSIVEKQADEECSMCDYYEYAITLEDVC